MEFFIEPIKGRRNAAAAIVLPYWQEKGKAVAAFIKEGLDEDFLSLLEEDFLAKPSEILFSYDREGIEKKVILLGLGSSAPGHLVSIRNSFAVLTDFCRKKKISSLNLLLTEAFDENSIQAILDGFSMANYSFYALKKESIKENPPFFIEKVNLIGVLEKHQKIVDRQVHVMDAVNLVRDLVNGNADDIQAPHLAQVARGLAEKYPKVECSVLGGNELEEEKMGLLLAVNRGSIHEPALIVLQYRGDSSSSDLTAIVGKGISFDTGGLNLKPTGSIEDMRIDMAGAGSVLGVIQAAASLGIKKNIIGVIAAAENVTGSKSYKPGDVYISHSGKSVEIANTDAEGRLVLADAFSYLQKYYAPTRIIDLATLTGGIVVAIGEAASGLFSNDDHLISQLQQASNQTGEKIWLMPLFPEYDKALESSIADIKNSGSSRKASPCMGATFLKLFINKDIPWAHLDIAGTAYLSEANPYYPSLATGVGVKLLTTFMENL